MKFLNKAICLVIFFSFLIICPLSILYAKSGGRSGFGGYKSSGGLKGFKGYKSSSGGHKSSGPSLKSLSPKSYTPKSSSSDSSTGIKVKGYYRKDGTYVRPHYRSSPESNKSNNFGRPSSEQREVYKSSPTLPTYKYDYDRDSVKNARDKDDDNDLVPDNNDKAPYNPNKQ